MQAAVSGRLCVHVLAPNYKSSHKVNAVQMHAHSFMSKYGMFHVIFIHIISVFLAQEYASSGI